MLYVLSAGVIIVHFKREKTDSFTHIVSVILIQVLVFKFQVSSFFDTLRLHTSKYEVKIWQHK